MLDSTDAATIASGAGGAWTPARTLFLVSSKSGGTIEPLSLFAHFCVAAAKTAANFAAITDPGSGLAAARAPSTASAHVFAGDPDIGGRYSALSPFGIVPAALIGVDVRALLRRRRRRLADAARLRGAGRRRRSAGGGVARRRAERARARRAATS